MTTARLTLPQPAEFAGRADAVPALHVTPSYQAFRILQFAFAALPIAAGLDKFLNLLTRWDQYLPGFVVNLVGENTPLVVGALGAIEIVAGIGVALRPRVFSIVVAAWLAVIIVNLLLIPGYFDVALRDLGLLLGALALGRLSVDFARR